MTDEYGGTHTMKTGRDKPQSLQKNLSQCHLIHHKVFDTEEMKSNIYKEYRCLYRQVSAYARGTILKNVVQIEHRIPI